MQNSPEGLSCLNRGRSMLNFANVLVRGFLGEGLVLHLGDNRRLHYLRSLGDVRTCLALALLGSTSLSAPSLCAAALLATATTGTDFIDDRDDDRRTACLVVEDMRNLVFELFFELIHIDFTATE